MKKTRLLLAGLTLALLCAVCAVPSGINAQSKTETVDRVQIFTDSDDTLTAQAMETLKTSFVNEGTDFDVHSYEDPTDVNTIFEPMIDAGYSKFIFAVKNERPYAASFFNAQRRNLDIKLILTEAENGYARAAAVQQKYPCVHTYYLNCGSFTARLIETAVDRSVGTYDKIVWLGSQTDGGSERFETILKNNGLLQPVTKLDTDAMTAEEIAITLKDLLTDGTIPANSALFCFDESYSAVLKAVLAEFGLTSDYFACYYDNILTGSYSYILEYYIEAEFPGNIGNMDPLQFSPLPVAVPASLFHS